MSPPKTVAPARCKRCPGLADYPSDLCIDCKHDRAERHREEARRHALEGGHPSVGLALVPPTDADLAALAAELGDEIAAVQPPTCHGAGDEIGVGLAGYLPGEEETCGDGSVQAAALVNAMATASEGSGPTPTTIPPPWEQDGPPYICDGPGCGIEKHNLLSVCIHRSKAHGLPGQTRSGLGQRTRPRVSARPAPEPEPQPEPAPVDDNLADLVATIDQAELLARLTGEWSTLGILEVRFDPLSDGRLAFQVRLLLDDDAA